MSDEIPICMMDWRYWLYAPTKLTGSDSSYLKAEHADCMMKCGVARNEDWPAEPHECKCKTLDLMKQGCKCGGI